MSESTYLDVIDVPLDDLSDGELWTQADRLRAYEAVLRRRLRAELCRRAALVLLVSARRGCQRAGWLASDA